MKKSSSEMTKTQKQKARKEKNRKERELVKLRSSIRDYEKQIEEVENRIGELETRMSASDFYSDQVEADKNIHEYEQLKEDLDKFLIDWEETQLSYEKLESEMKKT